VPASTKLQDRYGEDVQVIFVECQGTDKDVYEAFAWKMKWMGNRAMWTDERPIAMKGRGLPEAALIGVDGTVLLQGNPGGLGKKFEEAVAAELEKAKSAPEGTPKELEKAWQLFLEDDLAAAFAECDKVGSNDAATAREEFLERTRAWLARVKWQIDNGYVSEAEGQLGAIEKSVGDHTELAPKIAEQKQRLASADMEREREADKAFNLLVARIAKEKPFEDANVKKVESIASKFAGTKTAARAERFVALSRIDLKK